MPNCTHGLQTIPSQRLNVGISKFQSSCLSQAIEIDGKTTKQEVRTYLRNDLRHQLASWCMDLCPHISNEKQKAIQLDYTLQ